MRTQQSNLIANIIFTIAKRVVLRNKTFLVINNY